MPTEANIETAKYSTEPITGAAATAVTTDLFKVIVVFALMPMFPFLFAYDSRRNFYSRFTSHRGPQPPGEANNNLGKIGLLLYLLDHHHLVEGHSFPARQT